MNDDSNLENGTTKEPSSSQSPKQSSHPKQIIGVVGTGTMGKGIAQVAALAGHRVVLYDAFPTRAATAALAIRESVARLVQRGRIQADPDALLLTVANDLSELALASLVVEAIVEDLGAKQDLFSQLEEVVSLDCILASNTSSLSPTSLGAKLSHPERLLGLHFFNPVPAMALVEVVPGLATAKEILDKASAIVAAWGKTPILAKATPGFIVNRIARPFYAEAWRILEEQASDPETIDKVLSQAGGFPMGPFALMDLIGHDVNQAVTLQVWSAMGYDPRFAPSIAQRELVEAGWLGRKTNKGIYDYQKGTNKDTKSPAEPQRKDKQDEDGQKALALSAALVEHGDCELTTLLKRAGIIPTKGRKDVDPGYLELQSGAAMLRCSGIMASELAAIMKRPVVLVDRALDDESASCLAIAVSDGAPSEVIEEAISLLEVCGTCVALIDDIPGLIVTRTVAMLVNLAIDAVAQQIAAPEDIDTAMRLGTNYPLGPLAWGNRWGAGKILAILTNLQHTYGDPRYRPSPLLQRRALSGTSLLAKIDDSSVLMEQRSEQ
jgi:3-hydroxybutyryl-CoA dehydrogenase